MKARRIFWLLLLLMAALAIHYRQAGLDIINLGYKFGRLYLTKELVAEFKVINDAIFVYTEPVSGRSLKLLNLDQLQPIIQKSYNDYLTVMENSYPEILEDYPKVARTYPKKGNLTIIFVSPDTYESLNKIRGRDSSGYVGFLNTIYLKTYGSNYQINTMKSTIRHEIFHYLNNYHGLTTGFEETAAKKFGSLK